MRYNKLFPLQPTKADVHGGGEVQGGEGLPEAGHGRVQQGPLGGLHSWGGGSPGDGAVRLVHVDLEDGLLGGLLRAALTEVLILTGRLG